MVGSSAPDHDGATGTARRFERLDGTALPGSAHRTSITERVPPIVALIVGATVANVVLLAVGPREAYGVAVVAVAGWASLRIERARGEVPAGLLAGAVALLSLLAIARAPLGSHDLYSYDMYGRIFAHYHDEPLRGAPRPLLG